MRKSDLRVRDRVRNGEVLEAVMLRRIFSLTCLTACLAACFATVAPADDDAVKKKLTDAKLAYRLALVDYRQAVGIWCDKRESAARKEGNKKAIDAIKAERKAFDEKGELPKAAPKSIQEKLIAARGALETAYQDVIKGYVKASQDALAEGAEKDLKDFLKEVGVDPHVALPKGLPPAIPAARLKAKLGGRASYDQKTGTLTITYRFSGKEEFRDFDFGDAKPKVNSPASLHLLPGETAKHVVVFDTLSVTTTIGVKQMKGEVLNTTEGVRLFFGGANPDTMYLTWKGKQQDVIVSDRVRSGVFRLAFSVTEKRLSFQYATEQLVRDINEPAAGQVILFGGEQGYSYANLTISGRVNSEWATAFFAD